MPSKRIERRPVAPMPADFPVGLHPVLARIYAARGVRDARELDYRLQHLPPFDQLRDIRGAVELIAEALDRQNRLLVVGDFDADGATSTAVAVRALKAMGASNVDFLVPNRFEYGYGLTPEIVEVARAREPDVIITVDNGISSEQGVAAARAAGMQVLVTDHHLPGPTLPKADAIVNPNQPGDRFPFKSVAGVGVIFYVMLALRAHLRETGWFERSGCGEPNLAELLDLVALGTVADVVPLEYLNRIFVAQGLARIRAGRACPGVAALLEVAGRNPARVVASDLGFAVGPRVNAAGRLDDMSLGIRCLLAETRAEALGLASELDRLNRERRAIEAEMQEQAQEALERNCPPEGGQDIPFGVCLYDSHWHEGVIGLLASRVKERLHRPVIVFTDDGRGGIKGSARSIPGLHIRDALDAVAAQHPGLVAKFGGHAMAAGLTLEGDALEPFKAAFDTQVRRVLGEADLAGMVLSDGPLEAGEIDLGLAETLREAGPWGQGFPAPVFDGVFEVLEHRILKDKHLKLVLRRAGTPAFDAIAFNADLIAWGEGIAHVHIAYTLEVNEFRGRRTVQLMISDMQPAGGETECSGINE